MATAENKDVHIAKSCSESYFQFRFDVNEAKWSRLLLVAARATWRHALRRNSERKRAMISRYGGDAGGGV